MVFFMAWPVERMAFAFFGDHMDQHWPFYFAIPQISKYWQQMIHIMAINWPDMEKPKLRKQRMAAD